MTVLAFVGSLRAGAYTRMLFNEVRKRIPTDITVEEGEFGDWPLFNADIETPVPEKIAALKARIAAADAILFVTPEYNRSIPGGLKNMLDWSSRDPFPWTGKKVWVVGSSDGDRGANVAQYDLKRVMAYFGCHVLGQPEVAIGHHDEKYDASGTLTDERTATFLDKAVGRFVDFIRS